MNKGILIGICILVMLFLTAFTVPSSVKTILQDENEITATITKNTTEKDLENLKEFFLKYGIELLVKKVNYNDHNEITGLSLFLKKGESESNYSAFSNQPIEDLELGYKNENLFISNNEVFDIAAWKNQSGFFPNGLPQNLDSLLNQHNFAFDFDFDLKKEGDSLFYNGNFLDINKLKDQFKDYFNFDFDEDAIFLKKQSSGSPTPPSPKFSFKDDPSQNKLIIIDGKESDFETLDNLAKKDQLEAVDFLKPGTAVSIYGNKAKDGAVIATTKK